MNLQPPAIQVQAVGSHTVFLYLLIKLVQGATAQGTPRSLSSRKDHGTSSGSGAYCVVAVNLAVNPPIEHVMHKMELTCSTHPL